MRETSLRFGALGLVVAGLVGAGAGAVGLWLGTRSPGKAEATIAAAPAPDVQLWQCPMHPSIIQDHPGECPICGMKLVKVTPAEAADPHAAHRAAASDSKVSGLATVTIDPSRQQLIGLRTAPVEIGTVGAAWRTVGRVGVDETHVRHINIKVSGFVERVFVDFVGKPVSKGQALFSIYSPDLVAAQEEYLLALKTRDTLGGALAGSGEDLVSASRRKLQLLDIPASDIAAIEKTGQVTKSLVMRSPLSGVVTKKDVVDGMQLAAGAMPYEIVDLSSVWVLADVYESDLRKVQVGNPATLTLKAYPLRKFAGRVAFIDPMLDPQTRTVKVRLSFPNPDGQLKPEMFGEVVLQSQVREGLRIPADAVINSGTRNIAFVALGEGKFQPREVTLGESDGQFIELVDGLVAGDQVVTRANFLVDSESQLRASLASMTAAGSVGVPAPAPASAPPAPAANPHAGHGK
jgi:membrane fusion protein, copper/silver efflux system